MESLNLTDGRKKNGTPQFNNCVYAKREDQNICVMPALSLSKEAARSTVVMPAALAFTSSVVGCLILTIVTNMHSFQWRRRCSFLVKFAERILEKLPRYVALAHYWLIAAVPDLIAQSKFIRMTTSLLLPIIFI